MNAFYLFSVPAWLVVLITAAARLADLGREHWALRFHARRIGLAAVGASAAIMLATPFTQDHWLYAAPTWMTLLLSWSWAIVWLTTEGMPPWWDYILGVHRQTASWKYLGWRARLAGEWTALRASFRPRRSRPPTVPPYNGPERRQDAAQAAGDRGA